MSDVTIRKTRNPAAAILPDADLLCAFIRRAHPNNTAHHVEALTGVPAGTVEKWLCGKSSPGFRHFGALIAIYGPSLLAAVYPNAPAWLDKATRDERLSNLQEQQTAIEAEMRQLVEER